MTKKTTTTLPTFRIEAPKASPKKTAKIVIPKMVISDLIEKLTEQIETVEAAQTGATHVRGTLALY